MPKDHGNTPVQREIADRIMQVGRRLCHRAGEELTRTQQPVSYGQLPVLALLSEFPGMSQREIAEHLRVTPATISVSLKRMETAGLIVREPDPADRRITRIRITESGAALAQGAQAAMCSPFRDMLRGFSPEECRQLMDYVHRIEQNLSTRGETAEEEDSL